jgi:exonuclease SbcD
MRLLHTSDWHLGRSFHRADLLGAQAAFIDHLVETVRAERVDAVLVSGDVYDRALPPVDAVRLCDEALRRLAELTRVVLIAGNHDSAQRLGFGADLMDAAGVHVRTDPVSVGEPVLVAPRGARGEPVAVYGIPTAGTAPR